MWGASNDFFFAGSDPQPQKQDNSHKIKQIKECIANLEKSKHDIAANVKQCANAINSDFDELISLIHARKNKVLQTLNNIALNKNDAINENMNKMQSYLEDNDEWPKQKDLDTINSTAQKDQNEIFYTNKRAKVRFDELMNDYGDISLPLNEPYIILISNNSRNHIIKFKWNVHKKNNKNYKIEKVEVEWKDFEQKEAENENIRMNVVPNDKNMYEHSINVCKNGKFCVRIKYFDSNLGVWSKFSEISLINIYKISEELIKFDIFDQNYINFQADKGIICANDNGIKKGKYPRMIAASKGYNEGIYEWRIKCVFYDHSNQSGNASHAIGIFTNAQIAQNGANWVNDKRINYAYYWNSFRRTIYGSINGEYVYENNVNDGWTTDDVVSVLLDCNKWTIRFCKNGKVINDEPYKIKANQRYFPLIVMRSHNDQYQALAYE